jgi:hypothetical protein
LSVWPVEGHFKKPGQSGNIFGLPGTSPLTQKVDEAADDIRTRRAIGHLPVLRGHAETRHRAKSWDRE